MGPQGRLEIEYRGEPPSSAEQRKEDMSNNVNHKESIKGTYFPVNCTMAKALTLYATHAAATLVYLLDNSIKTNIQEITRRENMPKKNNAKRHLRVPSRL